MLFEIAGIIVPLLYLAAMFGFFGVGPVKWLPLPKRLDQAMTVGFICLGISLLSLLILIVDLFN